MNEILNKNAFLTVALFAVPAVLGYAVFGETKDPRTATLECLQGDITRMEQCRPHMMSWIQQDGRAAVQSELLAVTFSTLADNTDHERTRLLATRAARDLRN